MNSPVTQGRYIPDLYQGPGKSYSSSCFRVRAVALRAVRGAHYLLSWVGSAVYYVLRFRTAYNGQSGGDDVLQSGVIIINRLLHY